jgi:hypothetical protein
MNAPRFSAASLSVAHLPPEWDSSSFTGYKKDAAKKRPRIYRRTAGSLESAQAGPCWPGSTV